MQTGLEMAVGETIAVIDGDGQMPYGDIVRVYKFMKDRRLDFTKTYRVIRHDGIYRRLISVVYNACFRLLFPGIDSKDINSKPKIMTRAFYEKTDLKSNGWFIDAEIMILVGRFNATTGEIETVFNNIESRPSFVKLYSILEFVANLIWYRIKEFFV